MEGKVLLASGGTGIAAATAKLARERGAWVMLAGTEVEAGAESLFLKADLTIAAEAERAAGECLARYGRIDCLFNVAGISGRRFGDGPLHESSEQGWDMIMSVNLKTTFLLSRAVLRGWMARKQAGAILNMASVSAFSPEPKHFATHAYAASKAAIIGLTRSMAAYYAPYGIRVNAIAPGLVRTPMSLRAQNDRELMAYMEAKQPLSRGMLDAADIARAALFLLSDEARYITGEVLAVDGGWSVSGT